MAYTYLVPSDTQRVVQHHEVECLNLGLVLARYIPHEAIRNDDIYNDRGKAVGKVRSDWLTKTLGRFKSGALEPEIAAYFHRWIALTSNASRFEMRALGRVIVGLGGKGPLEIGITLHPITGLPHIPGSALKGLCRSYALLTIAAHETVNVKVDSELLKKLDEAIIAGKYDHLQEAVHYRLAFGSQDNAGGCVFFDGILNLERMLSGHPLFTLDVMTPHFVDYYTSSGGKAPHDGDNPNPVSYITVTEGVSFAFAVGKRTGFDGDETMKQARKWLRAGLQEMGIGSKTAQGYGVFGPVKSQQ